ncbi:GNAT family N-acetyltransferase [Myroides marinus]|uniref:GNAT family N-acetyltransferase n=1 Tax=Myroides marinus TaxID=703342 RepID=UPI0025749DB6|nr:GNAT family N-acetyltransferase [Myroides marinus]MDM1368565.1 GNAT family N-acetyltransferase [Myroides marinus]MDM1372505.1 GNAT family N-acetyltransferase [Myroides marinus]MDM1375360.1 GNAT family N-acetyltransferase [Myroides marinus]MDM1382693.1 GNAT family N-acetyltransferase [Myroides marinus]MDM1389489.1 GNAT family N-acetyltransferase [Myroides marinus]
MHIEITQIHTITSEIELLLTEHRRALGTDINIHNQNEEISMLYTAPRGTLYVAKSNNQIAGCITITRLTEYNCELGNLYIRPNFQGLGIGMQLCLQAKSFAKHTGYRTLYLTTHKSLEGPNSTYKACGFTPCTPYVKTPISGYIYMDYVFVEDDYIKNGILQMILRYFKYQRREQYR